MRNQLQLFNPTELVRMDPAVQVTDTDLGAFVTRHTQNATNVVFDILSVESIHTRLAEEQDNLPTGGSAKALWKFDYGGEINIRPSRLGTFAANPTCVRCGCEAAFYATEYLLSHSANAQEVRGLNLYGRGENNWVLFTVDHVLPDCIGGKYHGDNFQTMCTACNSQKSFSMTVDEIKRVRANPERYTKNWVVDHKRDQLMQILDILEGMADIKNKKEREKWNSLFDRARQDFNSNLTEGQAQRQIHIHATCMSQLNGTFVMPKPVHPKLMKYDKFVREAKKRFVKWITRQLFPNARVLF